MITENEPVIIKRRLGFVAFATFLFAGTLLHGQTPIALYEQLRLIFEEEAYATTTFGPARWLDDGASYTLVEPSEVVEDAKDIVHYSTRSGKRTVLVSARRRIPAGASKPLQIDDYQWSRDGKQLLLFTNTVRVWRRNTQGDYWVLDLKRDVLRKLGGVAPPSSLMFAKLSPDATRVGYVVANNLYVEDLRTGEVKSLTSDGSKFRINGTSDWVYEEEFGVRDGFRWSPDGKRIAYWSFDTTGIGEFTLINNTDTLYPNLTRIPYPKAGTTNSDVKIGVVSTAGSETIWMKISGDPRNNYVARMEWADNNHVVIQHLNRLQNTNNVLLGNATTGEVHRIHQDRNKSWVEVVRQMDWLGEGKDLLWLSEKDGWRHAYKIKRQGGDEQLITPFNGDVIETVGLDPAEEWFYFIASPDNATQRYLYRASIAGSELPERLTPLADPGTHSYNTSPNRKWAFHTYSRFDYPPVVDLVSLPNHTVVRTLEDNNELRAKLKNSLVPPVEMFQLTIEPGITLDAWILKPYDFDPTRMYPLLIYVYGEPAGQTVLDKWFGSRSLFHRALADKGFIVASFDNRGTPAPKGVDWRKVVYGKVGNLSSKDQAAAVQTLLKERTYIDGEQVAIWGWSGGGSNTLNAMFRFPDVFHVGISVAPVPDQRLYDTIYQERYMGLPQDNKEGYRIGSPINFVEGLRGKLLLIHGTGDDNVHYQGTERLVNRLVELGKPFDLMVYPNRSHSIREGKGTSMHIHSLITRYLLQTGWLDAGN